MASDFHRNCPEKRSCQVINNKNIPKTRTHQNVNHLKKYTALVNFKDLIMNCGKLGTLGDGVIKIMGIICMKMSPKGQDSITSWEFVVNQCQIALPTTSRNVSAQIWISLA